MHIKEHLEAIGAEKAKLLSLEELSSFKDDPTLGLELKENEVYVVIDNYHSRKILKLSSAIVNNIAITNIKFKKEYMEKRKKLGDKMFSYKNIQRFNNTDLYNQMIEIPSKTFENENGQIVYKFISHTCFLEYIEVDESQRQKGFGSMLLELFLNSLPDEVEYVYLEAVLTSNANFSIDALVNFYKKHNFEVVNTEDLNDSLAMPLMVLCR